MGVEPARLGSVSRLREFFLRTFGKRTACFMYPTANAGTSKASQAFWQVEDIERGVAELKALGVQFEEYDARGMKTQDGISIAGGAKSAWFKDSEGNILAVIQSV